MHLCTIKLVQFVLVNYYLGEIQYYTRVCMHHCQPIQLAEHVDATEIDHDNGLADYPYCFKCLPLKYPCLFFLKCSFNRAVILDEFAGS